MDVSGAFVFHKHILFIALIILNYNKFFFFSLRYWKKTALSHFNMKLQSKMLLNCVSLILSTVDFKCL